jgi:hypothetical protein
MFGIDCVAINVEPLPYISHRLNVTHVVPSVVSLYENVKLYTLPLGPAVKLQLLLISLYGLPVPDDAVPFVFHTDPTFQPPPIAVNAPIRIIYDCEIGVIINVWLPPPLQLLVTIL